METAGKSQGMIWRQNRQKVQMEVGLKVRDAPGHSLRPGPTALPFVSSSGLKTITVVRKWLRGDGILVKMVIQSGDNRG